MDKRPIGVFDSGVGGLSVLKELQQLLPNENFIFLADQLYVPYGEKSKRQLIDLSYRITDYFLTHDIKLMVVACNTATCYTIDSLRKKYQLPIVGTVPAIKPAAENTQSGVVAIISTPATAKSKTLKQLIKKHCRDITVFNIGCKNLEDAVENGKSKDVEISDLLKKYLKRVKYSDADHLVLGCTHYPFLKDVLEKIMNPSVKIIDSGPAIAKQAQSLLTAHSIKNTDKKGRGKTSYLTTGDAVKFSIIAEQLLGNPVKAKTIKI